MTRRISRRQALGALGTVSLGALLGACGDEGRDRRVATTDGGTALDYTIGFDAPVPGLALVVAKVLTSTISAKIGNLVP